MYIIINAMKNLIRNKGRNILVATITLAIIIGVVVTLTINKAASKVIDEIRLEIGSRVTIEQDIMGMFRMGMDLEESMHHIPIDDFIRFADSEYLSNTIFSAEIFNLSSKALTPVTATNPNSNIEMAIGYRLTGTSEFDILSENLNIVITEGRVFSALNEAIICDELAHINSISIGCVIDIEVEDLHGLGLEKIYQLTVVGFYSADKYERSLFRFTDIFTSFDTLVVVGWESTHGLSMSAEYFLRNPDYLSAFEREVRAKGLPDTYNVSINQAAYDRVSGPMSSLKSTVRTFTLVILVLGAIVLALMSFLAVRERKYEIGVLRAMGMEKSKVAVGIFMEAVMITAICLLIGLGMGYTVAQPIADGLLEKRVTTAEAESAERGDDRFFQATTFGGQLQTVSSVGYVPESEITVSLSVDIIIQLSSITFCLATLSGFIGVLTITQYEPLKILRERS